MTDSVKISAELDDNASPALTRLLGLIGEFVKGVQEGARAELEAAKASGQFNKTKEESGNVVDELTKKVGKLASAYFSVKFVIDQFVASVKEADRLDDLSDKTGIAANELKDLGYAAKIGGSSLDGLIGAFNKLGRSAAATEEDLKRQEEAFNAIGVSATDTNGNLKSSEQLFGEIADRFKNLEDGPEKSAIAFRLFGSEAKNLIPLLNKGSEGIAALKKESAELGGVSPEAFNAFAKASGDLFDGIDRVKTIFEGFFTTMAADVVPVINVMIQQFVDSAREGGLLRDVLNGITYVFKNVLVPSVKVAAVIFDAFTSTVKIAGKGIGALFAIIGAIASGGGLSEVKSIIKSYGEDVDKVAQDHDEFATKMALAGHEAVKLADNVEKPKEKIRLVGKAAKEVKSDLQEMVNQLKIANASFGLDDSAKQQLEAQLKYAKDIKAGLGKAVADSLLNQANALIEVNRQLREAAKAQEEFDKARGTIQDYKDQTDLLAYEATLIGKTAEERARLIEKFKEEQQLRKQINDLSDQDVQNIANQTRAAQAARDEVLKTLQQTKITNEILDQSKAAIQADVTQRIQAAAKLLEAGKITVDDYNTYQLAQLDRLKDKTKETLTEMQEFYKAAAQGIQGDLSTFIFDFAQGKLGNLVDAVKTTLDRIVAQVLAAKLATALFGADFAKGNVGGLVGQGAAFLGSLFGGARAEGGPVKAGVPYIVGERRAEVFVPDTNGQILPDTSALQSANNLTISITAMDSQSVIQALDKVKKKGAQMFGRSNRYYNLQGA